MICASTAFIRLPAAALLVLFASSSVRAEIDPDDQKLINAMPCAELVAEYKNYLAAEKAAEAEIQRAGASNAAVNIAGLAAFAALGVGFFTWDNDSSAEENLAELRELRVALAEGARKKKCVLPR